MKTTTDTALAITRVIRTSPDRVFRAWTVPGELRRWSCPEGYVVEDVAIDLKVGGRYSIVMRGPEGQTHTAIGTYREIAPPHRLVYTWDWAEDDHRMGETLVTVELREVSGATEVTLRHEHFPAADATAAHEEGWASCLNRLEGLFGGAPA